MCSHESAFNLVDSVAIASLPNKEQKDDDDDSLFALAVGKKLDLVSNLP